VARYGAARHHAWEANWVRRGRKYWEQLAAAARSQAETEVRPANREVLLRKCAAYERLAATAARIENDQAKRSNDHDD